MGAKMKNNEFARARIEREFRRFIRQIETEKPERSITSKLLINGNPLRGYWDPVSATAVLGAFGWVLSQPAPPVSNGHVFVDEAEWIEAVTRQGTSIPSYAEGYLLSSHWQITKDQNQKGRCEACGRQCLTHLHHVGPGSYARLGNEQPGDLLELCPQCHALLHGADLPKAA